MGCIYYLETAFNSTRPEKISCRGVGLNSQCLDMIIVNHAFYFIFTNHVYFDLPVEISFIILEHTLSQYVTL